MAKQEVTGCNVEYPRRAETQLAANEVVFKSATNAPRNLFSPPRHWFFKIEDGIRLKWDQGYILLNIERTADIPFSEIEKLVVTKKADKTDPDKEVRTYHLFHKLPDDRVKVYVFRRDSIRNGDFSDDDLFKLIRTHVPEQLLMLEHEA